MNFTILPCNKTHLPAIAEHYERLRTESGRNGIHFMPFDSNSVEGPKAPDNLKLNLPLDKPGWERCFVALDPHKPSRIIGHVDLKGGRLLTEMHRCTLGIGIEAEFCGKGLGTELLQTILTFARQHACLHWIELGVFHANLPARALYRKFGFVEAGVIRDKFRIAGVNIDDVIMTLAL